jgi:hypothetical protein
MKEFNLERDSNDYYVTIKLKEKGLVVYILDKKNSVNTSIPFGEEREIGLLETAIQERKKLIEEKKAEKDKKIINIEYMITALEQRRDYLGGRTDDEWNFLTKEISRLTEESKELENE